MPLPDVDLLLAHEGFLRGIARGLVADDALADDVVQETYLAALRDAPRRDLRAWLGGVARNLALMTRRAEGRRRRRERLHVPPAPAASVPEAIARLELQRRVVGAVLGLEEPYRSTVLFRHFYELPLDEIARRMHAPVETVRTRLRRALERLRSDLDAAHGGERSAWLLPMAAAALSRAPTPLPAAGGILAMTKTKLALGAALLLLLGLAAYQLGGRGGLAPARSAPGGPGGGQQHAALPGTEPATVSSPAASAEEGTSITVVDEGGTPLAGVAVIAVTEEDLKGPANEPRWYWTEPDTTKPLATSDAEGRVEVPELPDTLWLKPGYEPHLVAAADAVKGLVVTLLRGRTLAGRITDTEGRPIEGARVQVLTGGREGPELPRREAPADGVGEFRLLYLPARTFGASAHAQGYAESRLADVGPSERLDFTLKRSTLFADVTDRESGAPIEDAGGLLLKPDGSFLAGLVADETRPGRLLLHESVGHWHADAGLLDLHVLAPGHRTLVQRIELRADKEPPHVLAALVRGEEEPALTGHVTATAPAHVEVHARSPEGFMAMPDNQLPVLAAASCASDGAFAFAGLPPGRYRLVARAEGVGEKGLDVEAPAHDIEIELRPAATLVVQALSLDGQPVPDAWIHVEQVGGRFWCQKAGADGRTKFADLPAGRFRVFPRPGETTGKMASTVASKEEIELRAQQEGSVTVRVPSPVAFTYVVVDETGAPWTDATITLLPNMNDYAQILEEGRFYTFKLTTDGEGRAGATLFPGMYEVKVRAGPRNRRAWLAIPMERNASVRILLPRRGKTLRGRVVDSGTGEAIPGRPIYVDDPSRPDDGWFADGVTGPDGAYEIEGLPEGQVRVRIAPNLTPERNPYPDNPYATGYADVDLRTVAGPKDITLAREAATRSVECRIRVTDAKTDAPVEGALANAYGLMGTTWVMAGWDRTGADGRATVRLLPAKRYRFTVGGPFGADPPYTRQEPEIEGTESGSLTLEVALDRAKGE